MNDIIIHDIKVALPLVASLFLSTLVVLVEAIFRRGNITRLVCLLCLGILFSTVININENSFAFNEMVKIDVFVKVCFSILILATALFFLLPIKHYALRYNMASGEFYVLLFVAMTGMLFMISASHFVMLFLGIEITSISFYILSGLNPTSERSNEASLKYFLLGAFSAGFFLYGCAFIYGATSFLSFPNILNQIAQEGATPMFYLGLMLVIIGLSFKIATFPFHQWSVDVYDGSPMISTGFMATIGKGAFFFTISSVTLNFALALHQNQKLLISLQIIAIISMLFGNIAAISQKSLRRMLAYSSIGHAGFIMAGIALNTIFGYMSVITYSFIYVIISLGAFGAILYIEEKNDVLEVRDLTGLYKSNLPLAISATIFILALAGLPPTGGFISKYISLMAIIQKGELWLGISAIVASAIGLVYYSKIVYYIFSSGAETPMSSNSGSFYKLIPLIILAIIVIIMGIFPNFIIDYSESAIKSFFIKE